MNTRISRRGCLKMLAAGGALTLAPIQILQAGQRTQAMVITANAADCQLFAEGVAQRASAILLQDQANQLNALSALSQMSSGDLVVGLVNDAQRVLVESFIHDRRGVVHEIARFNDALNKKDLVNIGAMTITAALSDKQRSTQVQGTVSGNGPLISFYGYLS